MGFKCAIIGLPNVGKSTLFNALTKASVEVGNFPFCTIHPNSRVVPLPDPRLQQLAEIVKPKQIVPAKMEFIDIAGLVKGASKGAGLGNQFLTDIRETEAIGHVVRCFDNDKILHIEGKLDPINDIDIINTELVLSDLNTCERAIYCTFQKVKAGDKNAKIELEVLEKCLSQLENAGMLRALELSKEEKKIVSYLKFITLKPTMYIANINENELINNSHLQKIHTIAKKENSAVIPLCATLEVLFSESNKNEHIKFLGELEFQDSSLNRMIRTGFSLLNLQTYFTAGTKEVHAWTIPINTTALQAASKVHSDFQKGFIRAKTIAFQDFIKYKGEKGAKAAGKIRNEGKNYIVNDGDVLNFLFNV